MHRLITNRHTIFPEIHTRLNLQKSSSIEYVLTRPVWSKILRFDSSVNPWGHSVIRYDHPTNGGTIMNICGQPGKRMVNFFGQEDYLFTDELQQGNEQGGIFNRSFISLRIENIDPDKISELHDYYLDLQKKHSDGLVKFNLVYFFQKPFEKSFNLVPAGNCAYWTGQGLNKIGLIQNTSGFPMYLLLKLLKTQAKTNFENINIISYRSINFHEEPKWTFIHPIYRWTLPVRNFLNMDAFANIVVNPIKKENVWDYNIFKRHHIRDEWKQIIDL